MEELGGKKDSVMRTGYFPELYVSPVLNKYQENYHQDFIGVLRCSVDLGCINIHVEVDLLSHYLSQPQKLHLDHYLTIFSYLKHYSCSRVLFDSNAVAWNESQFNKSGLIEFYGDNKEEITQNVTESRGIPVQRMYLWNQIMLGTMPCASHTQEPLYS